MAAISIKTQTSGYFVVCSLATTNLLPRLSVEPPSVKSALGSSAFTGPGTRRKATRQHKVASNSSVAIVLKGSPASKTQGAFSRVITSLNHLAVPTSSESKHSQPPILTSSPSALASALKCSLVKPWLQPQGAVGLSC
ncbi:unnamed protein product [Polarella glacialis]|uniref:Uncharacterized protein n=1 Tax=Polarella glacialis TaxID=89957 RepID=A0A813HLY5_POLGL|nr:unnamed protein product [Polarella glacialis]